MASNIFRFLSLGLVGVQVLTLITLFISINFSKKNNITVTTNKLFELSDQENMIVFVVDSFDSDYMNQVLESYPEVEEWFEDLHILVIQLLRILYETRNTSYTYRNKV